MPHAKPIGPYTIDGPLTSGGDWQVGFDRLLNRRMWIRIAQNGTEPIAHPRRQINRPGRLRWVNGARTPQRSWDAYEAPDIALWKADRAPAPWEKARFWLGAAVAECSACIVGGEVPARLDLDAVVLGQSGEFLLLDEPIRELGAFAGPALSGEVVDPANPMTLVTALAARLQRVGAERRRQGHRTASDDPWPRHATLFFERLASTQDPTSVEAEMRRLLSRPPREGLRKRIELILTSGAIPLSVLIPLMIFAVPPLWSASWCCWPRRSESFHPASVEASRIGWRAPGSFPNEAARDLGSASFLPLPIDHSTLNPDAEVTPTRSHRGA